MVVMRQLMLSVNQSACAGPDRTVPNDVAANSATKKILKRIFLDIPKPS